MGNNKYFEKLMSNQILVQPPNTVCKLLLSDTTQSVTWALIQIVLSLNSAKQYHTSTK